MQVFYENSHTASDGTQLGIGVIGTLSGAVFAPISSGNAAKAFSGLSGATNAFQAQVSTLVSSTLAANREDAVTQAYTAGRDLFTAGLDNDEQVRRAIAMATGCSMAPSTADAAFVKNAVAGPALANAAAAAAAGAAAGVAANGGSARAAADAAAGAAAGAGNAATGPTPTPGTPAGAAAGAPATAPGSKAIHGTSTSGNSNGAIGSGNSGPGNGTGTSGTVPTPPTTPSVPQVPVPNGNSKQ